MRPEREAAHDLARKLRFSLSGKLSPSQAGPEDRLETSFMLQVSAARAVADQGRQLGATENLPDFLKFLLSAWPPTQQIFTPGLLTGGPAR